VVLAEPNFVVAETIEQHGRLEVAPERERRVLVVVRVKRRDERTEPHPGHAASPLDKFWR
jgi:hypothetical protein